MLSKEELLKPRYKVIADYPKSIHKVGTVYNCGGSSEDMLYADTDGPRMRDYPHLFKKLEWWEERDKSEFTKYIKFQDWGGKLRIIKSEELTKDSEKEPEDIGYNDYWFGSTHISCFSPVSREEYEQYLQSQRQVIQNG